MDEEQDLRQLLSEFIQTGKNYEENYRGMETTLANKLDNLKVTLSQNEKNDVAEAAKKAVIEAITKTPANVPTSSQLEPVLESALSNVGPKIKYRFVIKNRKYFWITLVLFLGWTAGKIYDIYQEKTFDGTAESWANRMYVVNKELCERNPGAGYDEIMTDFANGNAEAAKEKVIRKENRLSEVQDHQRKYGEKISEYLSKDYPSGIRITEYQEETDQRYHNGIFGKTSDTYNFVYIKAVTIDEQIELRIAMERLAGLPGLRDSWDIYITTDTRINSVRDYRQKAGKINWQYADKKAIQMLFN